ncbi:hypothetical protein [Lysobacter gummosus]
MSQSTVPYSLLTPLDSFLAPQSAMCHRVHSSAEASILGVPVYTTC